MESTRNAHTICHPTTADLKKSNVLIWNILNWSTKEPMTISMADLYLGYNNCMLKGTTSNKNAKFENLRMSGQLFWNFQAPCQKFCQTKIGWSSPKSLFNMNFKYIIF